MTVPTRNDYTTTSGDVPALSPVSSTSSQPSSSSHSHRAQRLAQPLAPERQPSIKGQGVEPPSHQRFKILRKGKEKDKRQSIGELGEDEDWTMEGMHPPDTRRHGHDVLISPPSVEDLRSREDSGAMLDSQMTEVPEKKEKRSRGRGLVKKTSKLFSRNDRGKEEVLVSASSASLAPRHFSSQPDRQSSYSSATSVDSAASTGSSAQSIPQATVSRQLVKSGHSRRLSHDSQYSRSSIQAPIRPAVSSQQPPALENRRMSNTLSASVPSLSRNSLPQPGPSNRTQDTIPSKMSSWFTNLLPSTSTTTISENNSTASEHQTSSSSPARKGPSAAANFLYAARQKAVDGMRHLLDTEAQPDKSTETIWVMGVGYPGYRPSTPLESPNSLASELPTESYIQRRDSNSSGKASPPVKGDHATLRPAVWPKKKDSTSVTSPPPKGFGNIFSTSTLSLALPNSSSPSKDELRASQADSPSKGKRKEKEVLKWPEQFHDDFRSRIWCTYRSQYAPIVSLPTRLLIPTPNAYYSAFASPGDVVAESPPPALGTSLPSRPSAAAWAWSRNGEERGLTTDAGWGCMLRTGQSMLANALVHLHLGRDWRAPTTRPDQSGAELDDYASYARILSWFFDDPSPLCPFSVHRMALIGKELGKEVGEWFGPSTASGALKTLANSFQPCGLAVATATDSMVYKSDVYSASSSSSDGWFDREDAAGSKRSSGEKGRVWGDKAVLILIGLRLGLDGVNPIYYDTIKALFTFPQSVGIAGGRPSSSYYFVGAQASSLFYLDPHFTRPAVPLEVPPAPLHRERPRPRRTASANGMPDVDEIVIIDSPTKKERSNTRTRPYALDDVVDVDDLSDTSVASSPTHRVRRPVARRGSSDARRTPATSPTRQVPQTPTTPLAPSPSKLQNADSHSAQPTPIARERSRSHSATEAPVPTSDPSAAWYATAYSEASLRTFHCDKVKKIPLSGLDPSMLLGFMCRNEAEFNDFCDRVSRLPQKIFTVQDEPPIWDDNDDAGLESVSEPDMDEPDNDKGSTVSPKQQHQEEEVLQDEDTITTRNAIEIEADSTRLEEMKSPAMYKATADLAEPAAETVKPRPPKPRPLQSMGPIGTDSWIRPTTSGQEAPNGKSVL